MSRSVAPCRPHDHSMWYDEKPAQRIRELINGDYEVTERKMLR